MKRFFSLLIILCLVACKHKIPSYLYYLHKPGLLCFKMPKQGQTFAVVFLPDKYYKKGEKNIFIKSNAQYDPGILFYVVNRNITDQFYNIYRTSPRIYIGKTEMCIIPDVEIDYHIETPMIDSTSAVDSILTVKKLTFKNNSFEIGYYFSRISLDSIRVLN